MKVSIFILALVVGLISAQAEEAVRKSGKVEIYINQNTQGEKSFDRAIGRGACVFEIFTNFGEDLRQVVRAQRFKYSSNTPEGQQERADREDEAVRSGNVIDSIGLGMLGEANYLKRAGYIDMISCAVEQAEEACAEANLKIQKVISKNLTATRAGYKTNVVDTTGIVFQGRPYVGEASVICAP